MTSQQKKSDFLKLFLTILLAVAIPLGAGCYGTYQFIVRSFSIQIEHELSARAEGVSNAIDIWMETNLRTMRQNAALDDMISMNPLRQKPILKSILKEYKKWANAVGTIAPDGIQVTRSDDESLKDLSDRVYFQEAIKGAIGTQILISKTFGRSSILVSIPIRDHADKIIGVMSLGSYIASISEFIANTKFGQTGHTYLLNNQGRVVAHYRKDLVEGVADFSRSPVLVKLGNDTKKNIIFNDPETDKPMIASVQRSQYGWIAIAQQDYADAFAPLTTAKITIFIIFAVVLTLIILIALVIAKYLTHLQRKKEQQAVKVYMASRVLLSTVLIAVTALGIQQYIYYRCSLGWSSTLTNTQLNIRSDTLTSYLDSWLDMHIKILRQNATNKNIQSMDPKKQKPILSTITKEYKWFRTTQVLTPTGQAIARSDSETLKNYADRDWFKQTISGAPYAGEILIGKTGGIPALSLAVPITDSQQKIIGILSLGCGLSDLSDTIKNLKTGAVGNAYLLSDQGVLLADQRKSIKQEIQDFNRFTPFKSLAQANKSKVTYTDAFSKKEVIAHSQKGEHGWIVVVEQDYDEILIPIQENTRKTSTTMAIILLFMLAIAFVVTHYSYQQK